MTCWACLEPYGRYRFLADQRKMNKYEQTAKESGRNKVAGVAGIISTTCWYYLAPYERKRSLSGQREKKKDDGRGSRFRAQHRDRSLGTGLLETC